MHNVTLVKGDATAPWALPDNSLDSIVTDPPYGIAFMGKSWDDKGGPAAYQEWSASWAREAYRCLKPGGFLLAFGATRMAHRMACGFEDAGFEVVDTIEWLYLTGFPKAQDIGKMFDKRAGAVREVVGFDEVAFSKRNQRRADAREPVFDGGFHDNDNGATITTPATDIAVKWDGWKTPALKPAHEPIIVARKPFTGTYTDNIERWGVGAINVYGCRIPYASEEDKAAARPQGRATAESGNLAGKAQGGGRERAEFDEEQSNLGRFPANVVMSHGPECTPDACREGCPVKALDEQSGILKTHSGTAQSTHKAGLFGIETQPGRVLSVGDQGGASRIFHRFFYEEADFVPFRYQPKASRAERNAGLEAPGPMTQHGATLRMVENAIEEGGRKGNFHPTVKPVALIRWLQRLVTPPGGTIASPFLGSGTDAVAAIEEGFNFWGMNLPDRPDEEYWPVIEARVAYAQAERAQQQSRPAIEQAVLF